MFLEIDYNTDVAVYTLKEQDHIHDGKYFPSLKRLYLLIADPTEYEFATTCLLGWKHWQRLAANKRIKVHVDEWREELEVKLRSQGVKEAIKLASSGSFQSAKWLADKGWSEKIAGRPSKAEVDRQMKIAENVADEFTADVLRLKDFK